MNVRRTSEQLHLTVSGTAVHSAVVIFTIYRIYMIGYSLCTLYNNNKKKTFMAAVQQ